MSVKVRRFYAGNRNFSLILPDFDTPLEFLTGKIDKQALKNLFFFACATEECEESVLLWSLSIAYLFEICTSFFGVP